jgi:hypothetical protein
MSKLKDILEASKGLLLLEPGWSGDDDSVPIKAEYLSTVHALLNGLGKNYTLGTSEPMIGPYYNGSIDIYWNNPGQGILVNIGEVMAYSHVDDKARANGTVSDVDTLVRVLKALVGNLP